MRSTLAIYIPNSNLSDQILYFINRMTRHDLIPLRELVPLEVVDMVVRLLENYKETEEQL